MCSKDILAGWPDGLERTKKIDSDSSVLGSGPDAPAFQFANGPGFPGLFWFTGDHSSRFCWCKRDAPNRVMSSQASQGHTYGRFMPYPRPQKPRKRYCHASCFWDGRSLRHLYITPWAVVADLSCFRRDRPGRDQNQLRVARTSIVLRNELNRCHPADNSLLS